MYNMQVITREQQPTSTWSGGTTTQLAIYPFDADYADRSFLWRLSTAVVEIEESSFTKLPGFDRHLMVLEGELKLLHQLQHTSVLKQYEQDSFKGEWDTTGYGKARDFNLMLKEGIKGELRHYFIRGKQQIKAETAAEENFYACYLYSGGACVKLNDEILEIKAGDMLLLNYDEALQLEVTSRGLEDCSLICAYIGL